MNRPLNIAITGIISIALLYCTTALSGCTGDESSLFSNMPPSGWVYGDTIYFYPGQNTVRPIVPDSVPSVTGDLSIVVRHNNNYEYSNIWMEVRYHNTDSIVTDTVNVILADVYGNWQGQGIGVSFQKTQKALEGVTLDTHYPVKISHIMRCDTLPDIEQVGCIFNPQ